MSLSVNAAAALSGAGSFATSRRGGLSPQEVRAIEAARARPRPTPWQALARTYGRSEPELRALVAPREPQIVESWPVECPPAAEAAIRRAAAEHEVTLAEIFGFMLRPGRGGSPEHRAHAAAVAAVKAATALANPRIGNIFQREKAVIAARLREHARFRGAGQ